MWLVFICIVHKQYVDLLLNFCYNCIEETYIAQPYLYIINIMQECKWVLSCPKSKTCSRWVLWIRSAVLVNVWKTRNSDVLVLQESLAILWSSSTPHVKVLCLLRSPLYLWSDLHPSGRPPVWQTWQKIYNQKKHTVIITYASCHFSSDSLTVTRTKDFQWHTGFLIHDIALLQTLSLNDNINNYTKLLH